VLDKGIKNECLGLRFTAQPQLGEASTNEELRQLGVSSQHIQHIRMLVEDEQRWIVYVLHSHRDSTPPYIDELVGLNDRAVTRLRQTIPVT